MRDGDADWRATEREHTDEVIATNTVPGLFERSVTRNADPADEVGELLVRGPNVTDGYWD